jgi:colicin import membrane protein
LLLLLALTWGINWKREADNVVAEAELWSSMPQQAAPAPVQTPVPPAPPPPPVPEARVAPPPPPPAVVPKEPDIAVQQEKQKQLEAQRRREELDRQKQLEARKKAEEQERQKVLEAKKKQEAARQEQLLAEKKATEQKRQKEEQAKASKAKADDQRLAALRAEQMRRIQGMAGATGSPSATGAAQRSAGPSDSYAGRIRARVKPNIVFADDISGNPTAEVEVQMAPDGTITTRRLTKSSGAKAWDDAVLRALDRTEVLPRDVDGRVHSPLIIEFRPKG